MYDLALVVTLAALAAAAGGALWRLRQGARAAARLPARQAHARRMLDEARAALAEAAALPRPAPSGAPALDTRLETALAEIDGALAAPPACAEPAARPDLVRPDPIRLDPVRPDPVRPDAGRRRTRPPHAPSPRPR